MNAVEHIPGEVSEVFMISGFQNLGAAVQMCWESRVHFNQKSKGLCISHEDTDTHRNSLMRERSGEPGGRKSR